MKSLLLIDDDPHFCQLLSRVLTRHHFLVSTATNAQQTYALLTQPAPAYAIVDLKLQDSSGLDLIAPLRAANKDMLIIVLTGYASIATTVAAIKRGADDYLPKPLDIDRLLATLNHLPLSPLVEEPMSLRRLEWEHIQRVLLEHEGNISAAARAMNMHRRTLQRRLAKRPISS